MALPPEFFWKGLESLFEDAMREWYETVMKRYMALAVFSEFLEHFLGKVIQGESNGKED